MTAEERLYYAVQEMIWAGAKPKEIKEVVLKAYSEVMAQEKENGESILRGEWRA